MRLIKMFGLAAIAVGAFMAFIGATSASAITELEEVVLCKALEDPCKEVNLVPSGTVLHGKTIVEPELLPSVGGAAIKCLDSKVLGNTDSLYAHGLITKLEWSEHCLRGATECHVLSLNLPYLVLALLTSDHKSYHVVVEKHAKGLGRPSAEVNCPGEFNCDFGENVVLFEVLHTGTNNLVVLDILQKLLGEGGLCSFFSGIWHAKYELKCLLPENTEVGCWPAMHPKFKLV